MTDSETTAWRPRGRDDVVFRRVAGEWLLFDPASQEIHVLNLPSALAWSFCTGEHGVEEIHREVESAYQEEVPEDQIRGILDRFHDAGLLSS